MPTAVEKVTAFITRKQGDKHYLLLFEHPNAGIQIPAGTVEDGETPEAAVVREVAEETGLKLLSIHRYLGYAESKFPGGQRIMAEPTKVYFVLFWAPLSALPEIIYPQNEWLEFLPEPYGQPQKALR